MRWALLNPPWTFDASIYFGCREPHLPLELGYTKALLEARGHEVSILDAQLDGMSVEGLAAAVDALAPDFTVITTAPSYLFWRCAPPELRVPMACARRLGPARGTLVVVGPHASTTPRATLEKLGADLAVLGECEEVLTELGEAGADPARWASLSAVAYRLDGDVVVQGTTRGSDMERLPVLTWSRDQLSRHTHHHHRFDLPPDTPRGVGAEVETSRGCPFTCTFCAKESFRTDFRKRPIPAVLEEVDGLIAEGAEYVYFIDEIFPPQRELLEALVARPIQFGVQLRIDLWSKESLALLGAAGCVSIEAGVESVTEAGRKALDKRCKRSTEEMTELLVHARRHVPFVQANLLDSTFDDPAEVEAWRAQLLTAGVWANQPVPLFPYPGSPMYRALFGAMDDRAWERAHAYYLDRFHAFSDIQAPQPLGLTDLEHRALEVEGMHGR